MFGREQRRNWEEREMKIIFIFAIIIIITFDFLVGLKVLHKL